MRYITLFCFLLSLVSNAQSISQIGSDIDGEAAGAIGDQFGKTSSLSDDGKIMAVGSIYNDGSGADNGHVRVYENTNGSWSQIGADIDGEPEGQGINGYSGWSVSLSGDGMILAIGAPKNNASGQHCGHVRVFSYNNGSKRISIYKTTFSTS